MEMTRRPLPIGAIGIGLAMAGAITYTLVPDKLWLVTLPGRAGPGLLDLGVRHPLRSRSRPFLPTIDPHGRQQCADGGAVSRHPRHRQLPRGPTFDPLGFLRESELYARAGNLSRPSQPHARCQHHGVHEGKGSGYQAYKERFDSYRQASSKLTVQFIDPERQPKVAQNYGITRTDIAIFESGPQSVRITSPAEVEITGALLRVSKDTKKRVVFLEGHGERSLDDTDRGGLTLTKEVLQKQGYDIGTVTLLQESAVPENTDVLIIAGPRRAVTKEEKERIQAYVVKGGHLLVLVDPDTQSNLDDLLKGWGLELGPGVLVDLQDRLAQGDLTALLVRTFTDHEITHELTAAVLFPLARHLTFQEESGKDWDYVPLARTSPRSWAETDMKGRVVSYTEKEDVQGPLALAAALTPKQAPEEGKPRPAIVVVGNSAFASNGFINFVGNSDFFQRTVGWLSEERDLISLTPKDPAVRPFTPNPLQERILLYVQVILLPAMTILCGLLVWRKRRRL